MWQKLKIWCKPKYCSFWKNFGVCDMGSYRPKERISKKSVGRSGSGIWCKKQFFQYRYIFHICVFQWFDDIRAYWLMKWVIERAVCEPYFYKNILRESWNNVHIFYRCNQKVLYFTIQKIHVYEGRAKGTISCWFFIKLIYPTGNTARW